jgi:glucuronosyltransferase
MKCIVSFRRYKLNTEKASVLFKDRPAKPVETAVWWTEYVLRNSDTSHLKPLAQTQFWFQRRLLDVWLFILAALLVIVFLCIFVFKKILSCLFSSLETTKVKSKSASTGKSKTKVKKT